MLISWWVKPKQLNYSQGYHLHHNWFVHVHPTCFFEENIWVIGIRPIFLRSFCIIAYLLRENLAVFLIKTFSTLLRNIGWVENSTDEGCRCTASPCIHLYHHSIGREPYTILTKIRSDCFKIFTITWSRFRTHTCCWPFQLKKDVNLW